MNPSTPPDTSPAVPDPPPSGNPPGVIRAGVGDPIQAERLRVPEGTDLCHGYPDIQRRAVAEGWTVRATGATVLKHMRDALPKIGPAFNPAYPIGGTGGAVTATHLAAAVLCPAGRAAVAERAFGPEVMASLGRLRTASLADLGAAALRMDHRDVPADRAALIKAAVSTGTLPSALGEAAPVSIQADYQAQPATWQA